MAKKKTQSEKLHDRTVRQSRRSVDEQVKMLTSLPEKDVEEMMQRHEKNTSVSLEWPREEEPGEARGPSVREADLTRFFEDDNETGDTLREIRDLLRDLPRNIVDELRNG